jgi:hypothetical protein
MLMHVHIGPGASDFTKLPLATGTEHTSHMKMLANNKACFHILPRLAAV